LPIWILQPDAVLVRSLDDEQAQPAYLGNIGRIGPQFAGGAIHLHRDLAVVEFEHAGTGRAIGQHNFVSRIFAEGAGTFVQPEQAGHGEPSAFALQTLFPLAVPFCDFGLIVGSGQKHHPRQRRQCHSADHERSPVSSMSCSSMPANSSLLRSTRSLSWLRSRSSARIRSARCRQANTAIRVESAFGALAAIDSISSLTLAATSSTSRESPLVSSVYGRLRMVTRTCCLSGALFSMRNSPQKPAAPRLRGAQLIDLPQQFLDAAAHLLALRLQGLDFIRHERRGALGFGGFGHGGFLPLPQPRNQLHSALYAVFEAAEGIVFQFGGAHSFSKAARADSFTARADCASSA